MSALDECIAIADSVEGEDQHTGVALDARAELAQLRADVATLRNRDQMDRAVMTEASAKIDELRATVAEQAQRIARIDADNRQLISEYKTLEDRFAEQARQLAEARYLIEISLSTTLDRFDDFNFDAFRESYGREHSAKEFINNLRSWLAAHPMLDTPQEDKAR